ncbi:hypothetical protein [Rubrivivax rivuli]|uniref:Uncharacterized protein n=1 Tax=Rubrivivax rivuli TaxID=1862385 RepID=A0A437RGP4_9BURK|nr:hypothetical protein [Rubrivivax rivuli]RVU45950.1 hypothetical protein EOE66_08715 [Rubrivivax rivuli]
MEMVPFLLRWAFAALLALTGAAAWSQTMSINVRIAYEGSETIVDFSQANWRTEVTQIRLLSCSETDECTPVAGSMPAVPADGRLRLPRLFGLHRVEFVGAPMAWKPAAFEVLWLQYLAPPTMAHAELATLANRHAPVLSFHVAEGYFPITVERLFAQPVTNFTGWAVGPADVQNLGGSITIGTAGTAAQFMAANGYHDLRFYLRPDAVASTNAPLGTTVPAYWLSQIRDTAANEADHRAWITYFYLFAYDEKLYSGPTGAGGNHTVDRESVTVEFHKQAGQWQPRFVIYAGHLPDQPTTFKGCDEPLACNAEGSQSVLWNGGRLAVPWDRASRWGEAPIAYVAHGSHAMKPARGYYFLDVLGPINATEPAGSSLPGRYRRSQVQPLDLSSAHQALVFSGLLIDGAVNVNSRVFPFVRYPIADWLEPGAGGRPALDRTAFNECLGPGGACNPLVVRTPTIEVVPVPLRAGQVNDIIVRGTGLDFGTLKVTGNCVDPPIIVRDSQFPAERATIRCQPSAAAVQAGRLALSVRAYLNTNDATGVSLHGDTPIELSIASIGPEPLRAGELTSWSIGALLEQATQVVWHVAQAIGTFVAQVVNGVSQSVQLVLRETGWVSVGAEFRGAAGQTLGRQDFEVQVGQGPTVNAVTPAEAVAGQTVEFSVVGARLPAGLSFMLDDCTGVVEVTNAGSAFDRRFRCTFAGSVTAGDKAGGIGPVGSNGSPFTSALAAFAVRVGAAPAPTGFIEEFAPPLNLQRWTIDGQIPFGANIVGPVVIDTDGLAQFGAWGRISTFGKVVFSGRKIVIEARMAGTGGGRDTSFILAEPGNIDNLIMSGDTNYCGWGMYIQSRGVYRMSGPNGTCGADIPVPHTGGSTPAFMEYRWTIDGDRFTAERGPTLQNITQSVSATLGRSVAGRSFFLSIGTASQAYSPGTFDWIRVTTTEGTAAR